MDTINIGAYGFLEAVAGITIEVKLISMKLAVLFAVLTATYGVVRFFIGFEDSQKIDFKKYVWTPLILVFLLVNYSYLIDITDSLASVMINAMPSANDKSILTELLNNEDQRRVLEEGNNLAALGVDMTDPNLNVFQKFGSLLKHTFNKTTNSILSPTRELGKFMEAGWVRTCRMIIEHVRAVVLAFLIIVGPIAILLSITPLHSDMTKKWYKMYVAVLLWALTINIMDALVIAHANNSLKIDPAISENAPDGTKHESQAYYVNAVGSMLADRGAQAGFVNFVFSLMYLCVPLLTAFFAGDKMAGGILSFVTMKSVDYAMKGVSAVASGGKGMTGSSIGGGGGQTSGME